MNRTMKTLIILSIILFSVSAFAQDRYERKSISYLDAVYLASSETRSLNQKQVNTLISQIKEFIEMERFDYNPIPEKVLDNFIDAANSKKNLDLNQMSRLIEAYIIPEIQKVLDATLELRAGELVDEAGRQSFLATKAKELGFTIEEIEKVMNSAYIYIPFLNGYSVREDDSKKYTVNLRGGIIWYQIVNDGKRSKAVLRVQQNTRSMGFGSLDFAFESAGMNFARNLMVATQSMPEFKLQAQIAEVENKEITFSMGTKEGIGLDNCFLVGEWIEDYSGKQVFTTDGWARVGKVADNKKNRNQRSSAWAVKYGSWSPGMTVVEHPRLGIDIAIKPKMYSLSVSKGSIPVLGDYIEIREDYEKMAPGFDLDAQINIARLTGKNQSFFLVGGNLILPTGLEFESDLFTAMTSSPPLAWGLNIGYLQKKYFGQLAVSACGKVGMQFFTVYQEFEAMDLSFNTYKVEYTISNNTLGFQGDLGLEYAATPDLNIGITAGYRVYAESTVWTYDLSSKKSSWNESGTIEETISELSLPAINQSGLTVGLYLHYTPPELPFDPASVFQGLLGR